uniref:hypothetical protein n=1 Tax=Pedobacter schmidteae TaxID=2201271 RepID=UPI0013CEC075|nr:hypothetical protein [Pedobacter schmidteae]
MSSKSTLGSDLWNGVSNTYWGIASLTSTDTYVNWYKGQKEYWNSSSEERGKADAKYISDLVETGATTGPLGEINAFKAFTSLKSGYGLKIGNFEGLYLLPRAEGMTILSYESSKGKSFRLDYHKVPIKTIEGLKSKTPRVLHYHTNYFGLSGSLHRSLNPWTFGKAIK